jgi:hypothetical protein
MDKMVVMLAVPLDMDGENCKMSRKGGSWEELKRTMTWCVETLKPGEAIEIQAQFPVLNGSTTKSPLFPVLVRCDYPALFSEIDITAKEDIQLKVILQERVLHRKV